MREPLSSAWCLRVGLGDFWIGAFEKGFGVEFVMLYRLTGGL